MLFSRGVTRIEELRKVASPRRLEVIRNTYRSEVGRAPINFEMVANLANLVGVKQGGEEVERIKAQIAFLDAWDTLKRNFKKAEI